MTPFDAEIADFIAATEGFAAPDGASLDQHRAAYDRMAAAFHVGRPHGVAVSEGDVGGVRFRGYFPEVAASPVEVMYFHGGGLVFGGLDSHDDVCAELAARLSAAVLSVDYRLAPEHPHPAAVEDAVAAARAAAENGAPTILAGDSAGAHLAMVAALALRDEGALLAGLSLIYPQLGGDALGLDAYDDKADAPLHSLADVVAIRALRAPDADPNALAESDWRFAPLTAENWAELPPILAYGLEEDPIRDDVRALAERVAGAGGSIDARIFDGLPHGCLRARRRSARAHRFFDAVVDGTRRLMSPFAADDRNL